jgi:hypothetical protein
MKRKNADLEGAAGALQGSSKFGAGLKRAKSWILRTLFLLVVGAVVVFAAWSWITLTFTYSTGDRAGYVQKFSKKGWIFKTWEGELAMVNLPGAMPEIFYFSVREEKAAEKIQASLGRRVRLKYDKHVGVPVSWFGETEYFVVDVEVVDEPPAER